MALYQNGQRVATNTPAKQVTSTEYNNLTTAQKNNGTLYFISDAQDTVYQNLLYITDVIGNEDDLADYADGTIAGCIADLYDKLNGLSFSIDGTGNSHLQATYVGNNPSTVITPGTYTTDEEKVAHLLEVLGDEDEQGDEGHQVYQRLLRELRGEVGGQARALRGDHHHLQGVRYRFRKMAEPVGIIRNTI